MSTNKQVAKALANYSIGASWANITGLILPACLKTGYYNIKALIPLTASTGEQSLRLANDGNKISGVSRTGNSGTTTYPNTVTLFKDYVYVKKGQIISAQASYNGAAGTVLYGAGTAEPEIEMTEVSK